MVTGPCGGDWYKLIAEICMHARVSIPLMIYLGHRLLVSLLSLSLSLSLSRSGHATLFQSSPNFRPPSYLSPCRVKKKHTYHHRPLRRRLVQINSRDCILV
ncbi:hypothetical protein RHMOL_Rhmol13G0148100 [Rhododendron molle]|uniref:Uncharacterized protein n=1 Tax=Rhododendron molle TaxID=49168 RepID=A0ACC0L7R2_RHOML|nr:hypothetical protein RHMOL_Rhmol13G0148100 [Rhododendron molle]